MASSRHSPHWRWVDPERKNLAETGKHLGKLQKEVIALVQPGTLLRRHRWLVAKKWDCSRQRRPAVGRPLVTPELEKMVIQLAKENSTWGYDRTAGASANFGYKVSDQTVGNLLRAHGLGPGPGGKRHTTWADFIRRHKEVSWATDFFATEIWPLRGLATVYVLFLIQLKIRRVVMGGLTPSPNEGWVKQIARRLGLGRRAPAYPV